MKRWGLMAGILAICSLAFAGDQVGLSCNSLKLVLDPRITPIELERQWASGDEPGDLPKIVDAAPPAKPRDVFIQFISAAKERNPAAAMALQAILARG